MTSTAANQLISTADVRRALIERREIAILDVGDEASFAEAHPLFAASLPYERLECDIRDRVPRLTTSMAVYDSTGQHEADAVSLLERLGFTGVRLLDGGLAGWRDAGGEIFRDVNVPSKAFGELVEATRHTPSLPAEDLKALLDAHADVVVLDARRFDEYQTMSIPGGISVPGGELVYRVGELAPRPETLVVVNCAGRTRSIIGAQSLVNAGIPNPVAALRNGTIGWKLAGLALDGGQSRRFAPVSADRVERARESARAVATRAGVGRADRKMLSAWLADEGRTLYRFDVRTPEEFAAGHLAGFRAAPGGQLVQETDVFAPVRGARIVLADSDDVRANMTASWLAQMAWEVYVLEGALNGESLVVEAPRAERADATAAPRARAYKRPYEGTDNPVSAMQAYLDWEYGLVAQLERDGTHGFRVIS